MLRRLFPELLVLAALSACGGGGGGDGGSAPKLPVATQANLTSANAPAFASAVDVAARIAATLRVGPSLNGTLTPGTLQDGSACGASPVLIIVSPPTGNVSGTANFSNWDRCFGMKLTGTPAIASGMLTGTQVNSLNFAFTNLSFTAGAQVYQLTGSAALQWIPQPFGGANYVMTLNATVTGAASFQLTNFAVNSTVTAGVEHILISGRVTMADGFVDINPTANPVDLAVVSSGLQNGSVTMTGATTIATVVFNGAAAPSITIAAR